MRERFFSERHFVRKVLLQFVEKRESIMCENKMVLFFRKKSDSFHYANKSEFAWKILIANPKYLNDGINQPRIGFQGKAIWKDLLVRPHQEVGMLTPSEAERNFTDKKETSILEFPAGSIQNTPAVSFLYFSRQEHSSEISIQGNILIRM